ncbi:MAG: hypothetical protein ACQET7_08805 [Thermodesulfobacteriota bacterium]
MCGVRKYASAQPLDVLDLDKKSSFLNWKLASAQKAFLDGRYLISGLETDQCPEFDLCSILASRRLCEKQKMVLIFSWRLSVFARGKKVLIFQP